MTTRDIIVIGTSAGGVQALISLVSDLPKNLPAAVFIVLHVPTNAPSFLPDILARDSRLPIAHATDGELITRGKIYVAPPNHHLMMENGHVELVRGPKENLHRPSIDALFRSAARWAGPRVIGVVLTGARHDGTVGMRTVKQRGGITIVQDPLEAPFPSMPMSVMQSIKVDYSLPLREIAPLLSKLSREVVEEEGEYPVPDQVDIEVRIAQQQM
jgi:two-component system chemotaxis response regulator CheB